RETKKVENTTENTSRPGSASKLGMDEVKMRQHYHDQENGRLDKQLTGENGSLDNQLTDEIARISERDASFKVYSADRIKQEEEHMPGSIDKVLGEDLQGIHKYMKDAKKEETQWQVSEQAEHLEFANK